MSYPVSVYHDRVECHVHMSVYRDRMECHVLCLYTVTGWSVMLYVCIP